MWRPRTSHGSACEQFLRHSRHAVPVGVDQPDAGAPVDDVVDGQCAFVRDGVLELRADHVDAVGDRIGGAVARGGGDHVRRLGTEPGDQ